MLHTPVDGREEYIDNEKYELRVWNLDQPHSLRALITQTNQIRRENVALQRNENIRFLRVENNYVANDQIIAYIKRSSDEKNTILVVMNLDPLHTQSGWVQLPLTDLDLTAESPYLAHDLLNDRRDTWRGEWNFVELDPAQMPVHIFRIESLHTERNFDYY
jgi:starch synthase (maltosyl-transferring)